MRARVGGMRYRVSARPEHCAPQQCRRPGGSDFAVCYPLCGLRVPANTRMPDTASAMQSITQKSYLVGQPAS